MPSLFHILNISRQDMLCRLQDLDLTSNNLANVNTTGFKSSRANFQELFKEANRNGSKFSATQVMTNQGSLRSTSRPLDWAVQGDGFFQIRLADGETGYTRDGQFQLDSERNLVDAKGNALIWDGEIPPDAAQVAVRPDGTVIVEVNGEWEDAGSVELARFSNPTGLQESGGNLWLATDASGDAETGAPGSELFGQIQGQYLEQANVDLSQEMTHLMTLQRAFQMATRTFQQTDQMIGQAINMRKA